RCGGAGPGLLTFEARRSDQPGALGTAGEQRLGALIHHDPSDFADAELATEPERAFQHGDPTWDLTQEERSGQSCDAAADDRDVRLPGIAHRSTLTEDRRPERPGPARQRRRIRPFCHCSTGTLWLL